MELISMFPVWVLVLAVIILLLGVISMAVVYFKNRKLEEIRTDVYKLFLKAEHKYKESEQGKQKMKWVVSQARMLLPKWVQVMVTEDDLLSVIQAWFDGIKDLLDDGQMNSSSKRE